MRDVAEECLAQEGCFQQPSCHQTWEEPRPHRRLARRYLKHCDLDRDEYAQCQYADRQHRLTQPESCKPFDSRKLRPVVIAASSYRPTWQGQGR
jgi:hypothetical protein